MVDLTMSLSPARAGIRRVSRTVRGCCEFCDPGFHPPADERRGCQCPVNPQPSAGRSKPSNAPSWASSSRPASIMSRPTLFSRLTFSSNAPARTSAPAPMSSPIPTGAELCLRPDLTVPACRYHLTHASRPDAESRYCYFGPAFRFAADAAAPSEFAQAGLEWMRRPRSRSRRGRSSQAHARCLDSGRASRRQGHAWRSRAFPCAAR